MNCNKLNKKTLSIWNYFLPLLFLLEFHTLSHATIIKTIGTTGDFSSITAAWAAIPGIESPITQPWIFELKSDYNTSSETFPINLAAINGVSATNTITIRPQIGVTNLTINTGTAASVLKLNQADYIIIDGRPGGIGTSELTIENTQTASSKYAIHLTADAIYNTIKYCTLKGSSYNSAQIQNGSVICIDEGAGTTNCDFTTICYCTITKSGVNKPSCLIGIARNTTARNLDNLSISNNNFYDFDQAALYSPWPVVNISVTNNNLYQTATWGNLVVASYGIYLLHTSNGAMSITGNYIGGQAPNCGGSVLNITSIVNSSSFTAMKISSYSSTATISSNTIQNIQFTQSTSGNSTSGITCIDYSGSSNYTIGASGNPNLIGSMSGTGSISIAGAVQANFAGILDSGTGLNTIAYNQFGAITMTALNGTMNMIKSSNNQTNTIQYNTIGNTNSNNITSTANAELKGIVMSGSGTNNCSFNTIQQFYQNNSGTSAALYGIHTSNGTIVIADNIVTYMTTNSNGQNGNGIYGYYLAHTAGATITGNTVQNFTSTGTNAHFSGIHVGGKNSSTPPTSTITNNTVGGTASNNMNIASWYSNGINCTAETGYSAGAGIFNCNNNTIQQFNITGNSNFVCLHMSSSFSGLINANNNIIKNISHASSSDFKVISYLYANSHNFTNNTISSITTSGSIRSYGIYFTGGTPTISGNTIENWNLTSTSSTAYFYGIYCGGGTATISSNTVNQISSASKVTATAGGSIAMSGIYLSSNGNTVTQNTISNLSLTSTTVGQYSVTGIYSYVTTIGTNTLKKNKITGLSTAATSSSAFAIGIYIEGSSHGVNAYNNIILLSNGSSTYSVGLIGIRGKSSGTSQLYHNTVKIYGTATTGGGSTAAYYNENTNTIDLRNNIFQNVRTNSGATGKHYAIQYATIPATVISENYNYLEASGTGGHIGRYTSDRTTLSNWKTWSGTGAIDYTANINIGIDGKVTNGTVNDVLTNGDNLYSPVPDDYEGTSRPSAPTRGAFEYIILLPIELTYFNGYKVNENNQLIWTTATELNNDFFTLEKTKDGINFETICIVNGNGSTSVSSSYSTYDYHVEKTINYYRLKQTDYDGISTFSELISIDNRASTSDRKIIHTTNILGQEIPEDYKGLVIIYFGDGSSEKRMQ